MKNLVTFVAALILLFPAGPSTSAEVQLYKTLEIGQAAPDFSLPGIDGRTYSLKDFSDAKILAVVFTANHCPTAQAYEDRIIQLVRDYKEKGIQAVAISPNDPKALRLNELGYTDLSDTLEEMKIRAKDKGFNFPYLYDGDEQKAAHAYGPVSTPHVFIFDKDRRLRYTGRIDNNERIGKATVHDARNAIEALLAGKPVQVEKTKTFGCSIKWSEKQESVREDFQNLAREPVSLEAIDSEGIRRIMKNESKKLRLINVWATWCAPCVAEFPELVSLSRRMGNRDFELVTISMDDPKMEAQAKKFLEKQHAAPPGRLKRLLKAEGRDAVNFIYTEANTDAMVKALDPAWEGPLPHTVVIAPGGKILYRKTGSIDPVELKNKVIEVLGPYYTPEYAK